MGAMTLPGRPTAPMGRSYNRHPNDAACWSMSTPKPALTFRNATPADVDAIVSLVTSA
jgi:hypothetical protein